MWTEQDYFFSRGGGAVSGFIGRLYNLPRVVCLNLLVNLSYEKLMSLCLIRKRARAVPGYFVLHVKGGLVLLWEMFLLMMVFL